MKQILYRIKSLFLLVAIAGGISACADDKGNYNYHDIPEVKIEGIGNSITALAYQNIFTPRSLQIDLHGKGQATGCILPTTSESFRCHDNFRGMGSSLFRKW